MRPYLGYDLTPDEFYDRMAPAYYNPQEKAVVSLLEALVGHLSSVVLDLGCGAGLATQVLKDRLEVVGADRSEAMVSRYRTETGRPGTVANFWDPLPKATSAVIAHALHLCPRTRLHDVRWRLREAGVARLIVTSPLKRAVTGLGLDLLETREALEEPKGKTVWAFAFAV